MCCFQSNPIRRSTQGGGGEILPLPGLTGLNRSLLVITVNILCLNTNLDSFTGDVYGCTDVFQSFIITATIAVLGNSILTICMFESCSISYY